ncbi:CAunnamed protein product [Biomphalaria glabrata]|nr:CAunnamed protein product [Biomphalaria glabrata]
MCPCRNKYFPCIWIMSACLKLAVGSGFMASPTGALAQTQTVKNDLQPTDKSMIMPTDKFMIVPTDRSLLIPTDKSIVVDLNSNFSEAGSSIMVDECRVFDCKRLNLSHEEKYTQENASSGNAQTLSEMARISGASKTANTVNPLESVRVRKVTKSHDNDKGTKKQGSKLNTAFLHTTRVKGRPSTGNRNESKLFGARKSKTVFNYRDFLLDDYQSSKSSGNLDALEICRNDPGLISAHPDNCAWYINCTSVPDAAMMTYFNGYVSECPYPQLFSHVTLQCEDFNNVQCLERFEPKSPCEYRVNKCHESSHCVPCWVRYASCRGLNEGLNPWEGMEWEPFFVECHKERTVFQGMCDSSAVFSPTTRACETPMSIPSKHGGWKPGCLGRRDGFYPDEQGRCDLYYKCKNQMFRGFHSCPNGFKFSPFTSSCDDVKRVPFPCGDNNDDMNVCSGKDDGKYLDIFGRCTHYFECRNESMAGFHVCAKGVFNVDKGQCDPAESVRKDIAMPCGDLDNTCLHRSDGVYFDRNGSNQTCATFVVCERGLTISSRQSCSGDIL